MIVALAVICLALVGLLGYQQYLHARQTDQREKEWALERGALLNRIQHPEIVPALISAPDEQLADDDSGFYTAHLDDIDLVGTVVNRTDDDDGD